MAREIPIDGLGLQGHFTGHVNPAVLKVCHAKRYSDCTKIPSPSNKTYREIYLSINFLFQYRLETLSEARVPLWLTEVDILEKDPEKRADSLESVMRTSFSHPTTRGLILWSFWDSAAWRGKNVALVDGTDWKVSINTRGHRPGGGFLKARWLVTFFILIYDPANCTSFLCNLTKNITSHCIKNLAS